MSVPILLRYWTAPSRDLTVQVHTIIRTTIAQFYVNQAVCTPGVTRAKCGLFCLSMYQPSFWLTMVLTALPSARPLTSGMITCMTLPMSFLPDALVATMT